MGDLQTKPAKDRALNHTEVEETYASDHGLAHTSQQAQAIRRWKQRRRQFESFMPS
jgi:hypothetical protein